MKPANIFAAQEWFEVLQTGGQSQSAVMTLGPGKASGDAAEAHEKSEQTLLLITGALHAEMDGRHFTMAEGDVVTIPCGVRHRFVNQTDQPAVTFSVYAPPKYPPDAKG